jgi:hypothetical protein
MPTRPIVISAFQVADRLSRFLWDAPADSALLQKATQLQPGTTAEVATFAREMLDDPRADAGVRAFYRSWLQLDDTRPRALDLNPEVWTSLQGETNTFVTFLTRFGGSFADLLQVPFSFLDAVVGGHYGVPVSGADFRRVDLNPVERTGLLNHGSWLASHPGASARGLWVSSQLFCQAVPEPPPPVETHRQPPPESPVLSSRERLEMATAEPACAACHQLVNPPGFLYEHYDDAGRYRVNDAGRKVNALAQVMLPGLSGEVFESTELSWKAGGNCAAQECFVRRWLSKALPLDNAGVSDVQQVASAFRAARLSLRELLVIIAQSRPFVEP